MRKVSFTLAASLFALGGCGNGDCRTQDDCGGSQACQLPDPPGVCGIACNQERQCETNDDCTDDQACVEYIGNCCFNRELSSRCQARCSATSCPDGEMCNVDGECVVIACTDDMSCPEHHFCRVGEAGPRFNGCVRRTCTSDDECGDGACVHGRCWDEPGTCAEPMLVP